MLAYYGRDEKAKRLFQSAVEIDTDHQSTWQAYAELLREIRSDNRDPDEWLRKAIKKDPTYTEGIIFLSNRNQDIGAEVYRRDN